MIFQFFTRALFIWHLVLNGFAGFHKYVCLPGIVTPTPPFDYSHGRRHDLHGLRVGNRPVRVCPNRRWQ